MLGLDGSSSYFADFIHKYKGMVVGFKHAPLEHPVIILIDNDDGAKSILKLLSTNWKIDISVKSSELFFRVTDNLYLVKTPEKGTDGVSCIENFFQLALLATKLDGKTFNPDKKHNADGEYGKFLFAEKVVRPGWSKIDFSGFAPLLNRFVAVIDNYAQPPTAKL